MKKRNINKMLYPSKWKEYLDKYGEIEAIEYYYKFCRSFCEEKYILKYGEEGKTIFKEKRKNINTSMSLENCIKRHGVENGESIYNQWREGVAGNKSNFIKRHGKIQGEKKFNEFSLKSSENLKKCQKLISHTTRLSYWIEKCNGDIIEAKKLLKNRQQTSTLDRYIKKYGKIEGAKKYQENNQKKRLTLENFVNKYGDIKGPEKYYQWRETIKYVHTKECYIKKYGLDLGTQKYEKILEDKINKHNYINKQSIIGLQFCDKLYNIFNKKFNKIYYGDKEYKFFIWENNVKIAIVDFYIKDINTVVEFYGDFWHRNPIFYNDEISKTIREKDENRIKSIQKKFGSKVIIIWENDYRNNKDLVILDVEQKIKEIANNL